MGYESETQRHKDTKKDKGSISKKQKKTLVGASRSLARFAP